MMPIFDSTAFPEPPSFADAGGVVRHPSPGMPYRHYLLAAVASGVCANDFLHREEPPNDIADRVKAITDAIMERAG